MDFYRQPLARNGFAAEYVSHLKKRILQNGIAAEIVFTEHRGHARKLAAEYAGKGFGHIIAVGGDGTISETAQGLVNFTDVIFGAIPAGTGNDFINIIGFSERFTDKEWEIFFQKNTMQMDMGKCNDNHFINGIGLGFDAQVAAENYKDGKAVKKGSKQKYLWHIIKTLLFYQENNMISKVNGNTQESRCFINTISIGRRFAGGFFLTPKAIANDGLLDVCMIKELSLAQRFRLLPKVPKGTHVNDNKVHYYQTDALHLEFNKEVPHHLDGELYFAAKFDVSILPKHLKTIYNPSGNHYFNR